MTPPAEEDELRREAQVGGGRGEAGGGKARRRSHDQGLEKLELAKGLLLERGAAEVDVEDVRFFFVLRTSHDAASGRVARRERVVSSWLDFKHLYSL